MANPRKKIPTGPTKDDLLSRLGSAFMRRPQKPTSEPESGEPLGSKLEEAEPSEQTSVFTDGDLEHAEENPPDSQPDPVSSTDSASEHLEGLSGSDIEPRLNPQAEPAEIIPEIQQEFDISSDLEALETVNPDPDPALLNLADEITEPYLAPEDMARWLESAGSAEAADLTEAMEEIEAAEAQRNRASPSTAIPAETLGADVVDTMLDDLLSALQLDDEDQPDPLTNQAPEPTSVSSLDLDLGEEPTSSPCEDRPSIDHPTEDEGSVEEITIQASDPVEADPVLDQLDPREQDTQPILSTPQTEPTSSNSEAKIPTDLDPLTLDLSREASYCLQQIQEEYRVPAEILVDVILRNWKDLPDWAKHHHLGLAHQIQVEQLLAGQQRTIQSIERLLAGDPVE